MVLHGYNACSQKFFEDLGFGRKFLGQTLLDLSIALSPRSENQFQAETFCLWKRVQANFLFIKDSSNKLSFNQREFKQIFCFSNRVQSGFLFIKKIPREISAYQRECKQNFGLSKRVQAKFISIKESSIKLSFYQKESQKTFCLSQSPSKLSVTKKNLTGISVCQRESKHTFCLSKRIQANFLLIKDGPSKFSICQ